MKRRKFIANSVAGAAAAWGVLRFGVPDALAGQNSRSPSRVVPLGAKPAPISIDIGKAAVIVCDMQNDFGAQGGMFDRAGIDITMIQRAVEPTGKVLASSRKAGIKVIYLKMAFRPDLSDMGLRDSPNWRDHHNFGVGTTVRAPNGAESRILVRDTWNTDIVAELTPRPADIVIYKNRFSGFYQTDLDAILRRLGVRYLIVTGCTTSVCVESTIRDATFRDYSPVLLADCTGEPVGYGLVRSNHDASLLVIEKLFGWISTSEEFIRALESLSQRRRS